MALTKRRDSQTDNRALEALDRMSLSEIYRHEVLQSRRDRSRRAFFWARIFGLALMLTIGATLRSEPELRSALAAAGMDAIKAAANRGAFAQTTATATPSQSMPPDQIKVNRFGAKSTTSEQQIDAQMIANEVGRRMAAQQVTN